MSSAMCPPSELGRVHTLSAGPTAATPETLSVLSRPALYRHYDPEFLDPLWASPRSTRGPTTSSGW